MYRHGFARQFGANNDPHRASLAAAAAVASIQQPHPTIAAAAAKAAAAQAVHTLPMQSITPRPAFTLEIEDSKPGKSYLQAGLEFTKFYYQSFISERSTALRL
jgi:hypothetical protein